ncbi:hypothetical protein HanPSC8_Chr02g0053501 [Helianthus annuus]|nr:hypothetical protein HanPSC8_Chr02g0053501 [Helianthus annuus]
MNHRVADCRFSLQTLPLLLHIILPHFSFYHLMHHSQQFRVEKPGIRTTTVHRHRRCGRWPLCSHPSHLLG